MVEDTWQWQNWQGLPYLTCTLLDNWQHGFFTRQFSPRLPAELVSVWQPELKAYRLQQVHGNRVLSPQEIEQETRENSLPCGDALIADGKQQSLWVASADCTPALIGDLATGRVAAIHAGWRGTAKGIVPETIARFLEFGSSLANLRVALGPAIAGEVYQVTEAVAAEVMASLCRNQQLETSEAILATFQRIPDAPLIPDSESGRIRLDVRRTNALQLEQLGIAPPQIAIAPYCTYQQPEYFFSYRRTQKKSVQWSGIISSSDFSDISLDKSL
jgi:YfiH family protein